MQIPAPTNRFSARRGTLFAALIATALLALPASASATPLWPDTPNSPVAETVLQLFIVVFAVGLVALIGYTLALLGAGRNEVDADAPAPAESSAKGAVIAGSVVFVLFALIGGYAFSQTSTAKKSLEGTGNFKTTPFSQVGLKVPHNLKAPEGPAYSIRVNAQQFLWRYEYTPLQGTKPKWATYSYNELVLPAGVTVMLDFTSSDAEAAWWVPQLGGSITALPGYDNKFWVRADKSGLYNGAGTVVNGTNYASMTTKVSVVDPRLFARWVVGKGIEINEAMTALGLERTSGVEEQLISGEKGAEAATAESEVEQTQEADAEGKNQ